MKVRILAERCLRSTSPHALRELGESRRAWHETEEEIRAGIRWGRKKAELLRWVRRKMRRRLTARERRCVELYYFQGLTLVEVGCETGTNATSALRAVRRSVNKLRALAEKEGVTMRGGVPARRRWMERRGRRRC